MYNIIIFKDKKGRSEITDYIKKLSKGKSKDDRIKFNKIISYVRILKSRGFEIGEPYIKHLEDDIWELRPLRDRILFAYCDDDTFILLSLFVKKTRKTPRREIEKAKRLLEIYKGDLKNE